MRAQKRATRCPSAQYMKVNAASQRATLAVMPKKAAVRREGRRRRRLAPNTSIKTLVTAVGTAYSENEYRAASIIDTFNLPAELREGLIVIHCFANAASGHRRRRRDRRERCLAFDGA